MTTVHPPVRYVELLGAPGVGKTALADVLTTGKHSDMWLDARRAVRVPRWSRAARTPGDFRLQQLSRRLPGKLGWYGLLRDVSANERIPALDAAVRRWPDFFELVLGHTQPDPRLTPTMQLTTRRWLIEHLELRALTAARLAGANAVTDATRRSSPRFVFLDEGLTHPYKLDAAIPPGADPALRARYREVVPPPDVCVYLTAPMEVLSARAAGRRDSAAATWRETRGEQSADNDSAELARVTAEVGQMANALRDRDVQVVEIDAQAPSAQVALRLTTQLLQA